MIWGLGVKGREAEGGQTEKKRQGWKKKAAAGVVRPSRFLLPLPSRALRAHGKHTGQPFKSLRASGGHKGSTPQNRRPRLAQAGRGCGEV